MKDIYIVGTGKLANELLSELSLGAEFEILAWPSIMPDKSQSIIIHAGSGKDLPQVIEYCAATQSTLIELATGSDITTYSINFPVVLCPNTNILMLKFMNMLEKDGGLFEGYNVKVVESHQSEKSSTPGTAVSIAQSLGVDPNAIISVRDKEQQLQELKIPKEHLDRHAFHRIKIEDDVCTILMETSVYGSAPYAKGVAKIVAAINSCNLENRMYAINEFVENGWI